MGRHLIVGLVAVFFSTGALAQSARKVEDENGYNATATSGRGLEVRQEQNNETIQENTGVVNQSAVYNVGQAATYRIDNIICPEPAFVVSGAVSNSNYSLSASLVYPLGGDSRDSCQNALESRATHYATQNEVNIIQECLSLSQAGVELSPEKFPVLGDLCQGVN